MKSHTPLAKFIHWSFSILYAYGIFKQVGDLSELQDPALLNFEILFAVAFLVIVFIRYFYINFICSQDHSGTSISMINRSSNL